MVLLRANYTLHRQKNTELPQKNRECLRVVKRKKKIYSLRFRSLERFGGSGRMGLVSGT